MVNTFVRVKVIKFKHFKFVHSRLYLQNELSILLKLKQYLLKGENVPIYDTFF